MSEVKFSAAETLVPSLKMGIPSVYIWTFREGIQKALLVVEQVSQNIKSK